MSGNIFRKALAQVKPENRQYVRKNLDIVEQVVAILHQRGMSQRELAQRLGKSEAEVSRMLSGLHNLTLKTLTKLEVALGEDIITTPLKAAEQAPSFKQGKVTLFTSQTSEVTPGAWRYASGGNISPEMTAYGRKADKVKNSNRLDTFERAASPASHP